MPPLEEMDRYQTAVYWEKTGEDAYGEPLVADPVELSPDDDNNGVRWSYNDTYRVDAQGNAILINASVVVGEDIKVGSIMRLGPLSEVTGTADTFTGLMEVVNFVKTQSIDNEYTFRRVDLKWYRDTLPQIG